MARPGLTAVLLLWAALTGWALAAGCGDSAQPAVAGSSGGEGGTGTDSGSGAAAAGGQGSGATGASASGGSGGVPVPTGGWQPLPWLAGCDGERLDLETESWPARTWQSCGTGCLEAEPLNIPDQAVAFRSGSGATVSGGEIFYRTSTHTDDVDFEVVERLSDGAVLLVIRFDGVCFTAARKTDAPFVIEVARVDGSGLTHAVGRFDHAAGTLVGAGPYEISSTPCWFTFAQGWGLIHGSAVRVVLDPAVAELTTIFPPNNNWLWPARGRGDLIAWVDWGVAPSPIRSWTLAGGNNVLVSAPWDVVTVALGEDTIAWVGATGAQTILGAYDTAALYWSPFSTDPAAISVSAGPDLTGQVMGTLEPVVAGDHIALNGVDGLEWDSLGGIIVVRMSTQQKWFIPPRPGTFLAPVAISATEILATETNLSSHAADFDRYLRLELSALDSLAQGWPEP